MRSDALIRRGRRARLGQAGVSLIEATVLLAITSMLTAILAPSVRSFLQGAQQTAARRDVEIIGTAISRMLTDVGEVWFLRSGQQGSGSSATSHNAPAHGSSNRVDLLVSDGKTPALYSGAARVSSGVEWTATVNDAAVQKLEYFLVTNRPSNDAAKAYRNAAAMSATDNFDPSSGRTYNSTYAWRGPYLPGPISADPWGYRYAVNVEFLERPTGTGPSGNVNDTFVLSAGSNGLIETRIDIDGASSGNDIIYIVSGGTR